MSPKGTVEAGAKAIRPRARVHVHRKDGLSDFSHRERGSETVTVDGSRGVQIREQEIPGVLNQLAREVGVEVVKDHSFSRLSGVANIGIVQGLDVIFPSAARSRGMKEAGVLVPMEGDLEREALAPIGQLVPVDSLEGRGGFCSQGKL